MADARSSRRRRRSLRVEKLGRDTYEEILLHLPPEKPILLFRYAMVCRAWRDILRDPVFILRYRKFHGAPPMLSYLYDDRWRATAWCVATIPTPLTPRLPNEGRGLRVVDCRHGRALFIKLGSRRRQSSLLLWDPLTNIHQEVRLPEQLPGFIGNWSAAILCDARPCNHVSCHGGPFRVVFVGITDKGVTNSFVYSSSTSAWAGTASVQKPGAAAADKIEQRATTLVGATVFFRTAGKTIIRYDFGGEVDRLSFVEVPSSGVRGMVLIPAAGGRIRFADLVGVGDSAWLRLWEANVSSEATGEWEKQRSLRIPCIRLVGFAEGTNALLVTTGTGTISFDLQSESYKILPKPEATSSNLTAFSSFYTPGEL